MNKKSMILATLLSSSEISASVEGFLPIALNAVAITPSITLNAVANPSTITLIPVTIPSTIITSEIS